MIDIPSAATLSRLVDLPPFPKALICKVRVLLDGVEQRKCFAHNIPEGWIARYKTDPGGNMYLDRPGDNHATWEKIHGRVEVIPR